MLLKTLKGRTKFFFGPKLGSGYWTQLGQWILYYTVWKFQDFSVILILREINFGEFRSSQTAVFAILGALNFVDLGNFNLQIVQKLIKKSTFLASVRLKMAYFAFPKLISRKM